MSPDAGEPHRDRLAPRTLTLLYLGYAYVCLGTAFVLLAVAPQSVGGFFYHPKMLAVVHLVTLPTEFDANSDALTAPTAISLGPTASAAIFSLVTALLAMWPVCTPPDATKRMLPLRPKPPPATRATSCEQIHDDPLHFAT